MSARLARTIGATTAASGAGLLLAPGTALRLMGAQTTDPAPFLFRIVGLFMAISGATLVDGGRAPLALRWSLVQKVGATTAMCWGVRNGTYSRRALAVAAFDGASAVLLAGLILRGDRRGAGTA